MGLEAFVTYGFNGFAVLIHIWDTTLSPPRMIECNCPKFYGTPGHSEEHVRNGSIMPYAPAPTVMAAPVATFSYAPVYSSVPMGYMHVSAATMSYNTVNSASLVPSAPYVYQANNTTYSYGVNGMPVDMSGGLVPTVARKVHFTNLDYTLHENDLRRVIQEHAHPIFVDIQRRINGASQGWATAEFASENDALLVVARLNNQRLGNRSMKVKLDANRNVVQPAPVIAVGSGSATAS
jgi:hypothetical protein